MFSWIRSVNPRTAGNNGGFTTVKEVAEKGQGRPYL